MLYKRLSKRLTRKKALVLIAVSITILFIASILYDLYSYTIAPCIDTRDVVVLDGIGLLLGNKSIREYATIAPLTIDVFRTIGKTSSKLIIVVTHGLWGNEFGLATIEEPSIANALKHPELLIAGVLKKGVTGYGERLALTDKIIDYMACFNNQTIVLITCYTPRLRDFAEKLKSHGAYRVYYSVSFTQYSEVYTYITGIVEAYRTGGLESVYKLLDSDPYLDKV